MSPIKTVSSWFPPKRSVGAPGARVVSLWGHVALVDAGSQDNVKVVTMILSTRLNQS